MQYYPILCNIIPYYLLSMLLSTWFLTFTRVSHCQDMLIQKFLAGIANMAAFSREVNRDGISWDLSHIDWWLGFFFWLTD